MASATERTMTNTSPTALEEIRKRHDEVETNYGDEPWDENCIEDGEAAHKDRATLLTHIAALEAELVHVRNDLADSEDHANDLAEAQLATRLPTEAQISYLLEVLAREGVANDGGDFMRRKISKAILELLSGAATPAPTAALTEEDVWLKPPPHFIPDPRWQRQPQSNEEWNAHKDMDRQFNAKRRLAFAGDVDDPRAPKCMALVSRLDLNVVLGRLTWLEARFENTRRSALSSPPEPGAKSPPQGADHG